MACEISDSDLDIIWRIDAQYAVIRRMWEGVVLFQRSYTLLSPSSAFVLDRAAFLSVCYPSRSGFAAYLNSTAESYATPLQLEKWIDRSEDYEGQNDECVGGIMDSLGSLRIGIPTKSADLMPEAVLRSEDSVSQKEMSRSFMACRISDSDIRIIRQLDFQYSVIRTMWRTVLWPPSSAFVLDRAAFLSVCYPTRSAFAAYLNSTAECYATPLQLEKWIERRIFTDEIGIPASPS